jgi:hypothetical protein
MANPSYLKEVLGTMVITPFSLNGLNNDASHRTANLLLVFYVLLHIAQAPVIFLKCQSRLVLILSISRDAKWVM